MSAEGPDGDWPGAAIAFLAANLPFDSRLGAYDQMFSTAYQGGVMALAALGQLDETDRGAVPRQPPALPAVLPRWDDICMAVLWLADQQGAIAYRTPDGGVPPRRGGDVVILKTPPPVPAPNIAAGPGRAAALPTPTTKPSRRWKA